MHRLRLIPKGNKMKKSRKWVLGIVAAVVVLMIIGGLTESSDKEADTQQEAESLPTIAASELAFAYEQNTVAADARFKGKRFKISGVITNINTGITGKPYVVLQGVNQFMGPQFQFAKESNEALARLQKGMLITMVCTGRGDVAKTPMSDKCSLVN